jgi:TRAP-type mannitol/chloroaromatic compound transport system substrate-binding protein
VILCPASEIFTNLERGVIDATEWIGPLHDQLMGFYKVAKYYYYPGWHETGPFVEFVFNKKAYEALPVDFQAILDAACAQASNWTTQGFNFGNGQALDELINVHKVDVVRLPDSVLAELKSYSKEAIAEIAASDPMAKKVNESFEKFQKVIGPWGEISEKPYYETLADRYPLKG